MQVEPSELTPTLHMAVNVWWAVFWRILVLYALAAVGLVFILPPLRLGSFADLAFPVLYVLLQIISLKKVLGLRFRRFRLVIYNPPDPQSATDVPEEDTEKTTETRASLRIAFRIWWALTWRLALASIPSTLVYLLSIPLFRMLPHYGDVLFTIFCMSVESLLAILVFRQILGRDYGWFRLAVLPKLDDDSTTIPVQG